MKKFLRALLFLLLLGGIVFALLKLRLLPNPFESGPSPSATPGPEVAGRSVLRVAVASRPEKLLMSTLQRFLKSKGFQLEVVEYHPDTVWLELASRELDLVIVPIGEAVLGQGRFDAGRMLFFTGESVGLDQLLARPNVEKPKRVGVYRRAATELLARQILPEATVVPGDSLKEVEGWLSAGAVDAALVDTSSVSADLGTNFKLLSATSPEFPMPSVAVLSRDFAENSESPAYADRRQVLEEAIGRWAYLVGLFDTQPAQLKANLKQEADKAHLKLDPMLEGYRFFSPASGRLALEQFQQSGTLEVNFEALVLSGANNLRAPDWVSSVELPPALREALANTSVVLPSASPTPESTPSPVVSPTPSQTSSLPGNIAIEPTYTYLNGSLPTTWPEPLLTFKVERGLNLAPALSAKQVAALGETEVVLHEIGTGKISVPIASPLTGPVLFDGQNFVLANQNTIQAVNSQGKQVWQVEAPGVPMAATQLMEGKLYFSVNEAEKSRVLCLDKVDGELLWSAPLDSPPTARPLLAQGESALVVVATEKGELRAFNAAGGQAVWSQTLSSPVFIEPAAGYGKIALVRANGSVTMHSLSDGKKEWEIGLGTQLIAPPTVTSSGVLVPSKDTYLYHLNHTKGDISWKTRLSKVLSEPAVVAGQTVAQSDEGGAVHLLELSDGALKQTQAVSGSKVSQVTMFERRWALMDDSGTCRVYQVP